jgi:hypothetical protein
MKLSELKMLDTLAIGEDDAQSLANLIMPMRRPKSFLDFCHTMRLPDGPKAGRQFRPETEPAQMHFVRAVDSHKWNKFALIWPSQRGKSTVGILAPWLYSIVEEGFDFGYILPNLTTLDKVWLGKLKPGISGSGFGGWLPTHGPGSKDGRPAALPLINPTTLKTVLTYFMAAGLGGRETSMSAVSPARVGIDEADDLISAGQIELAMKRLESWGKKGKAFIASTVNTRAERESHPILDFHARDDATGCRIAHKCPDCGGFQVVEFEQLMLDSGKVACSLCGCLWGESKRAKALADSDICFREGCADGKIIKIDRKTEYFTLLASAMDFNMGDFSSLAPTYLAAKDREKLGDYSLMETFQQKALCRPYSIPVDHETVTDRMLALRSAQATCGKGVCPDDVERIVVGIDVQGDRCYWVTVGSGTRDRRWIIDYDEWFWTAKDPVTGRPIEPSDADRHAVLDRVLAKARDGWARADGTPVRASLVAVDIGYNPGGSVGRWVAGKAGIVAVRGDHENRVVAESLQGKVNTSLGKFNSLLVSDHGMYEIRKQESQPGQPGIWWFVKSQTMREHVMGRLRLPIDADGSLMLCKGVAEKDYLIQHLSSWAIVREPDSKLVRWVQVRKRDDFLDATDYAIALLSQQPRHKPSGPGTITTKDSNHG